jgi:Mn2+/Fe2+ NRAMP family transporter
MDSFMFLFLENYGVRKLEAVFAVLIATMALSFAWMFGDTKPNGKELLMGKNLNIIWMDIKSISVFLLSGIIIGRNHRI